MHILIPARLSPERYKAACSIFRDTADEDYLFARVAWMNLNFRQFSWSASQAVEKYLKCALLVQGGDAKFSHNWNKKIGDLWAICEKSDYKVLLTLEPASCDIIMHDEDIYQESLSEFLGRISKNGHTGVRYNEYDYLDIEVYDLHKFDSVCYLLRDLCIPRDGALLEDDSQAGEPKPALMAFPRKVKDSPNLSAGNYSFFPERAGSPILHRSGISSPLAMLITKGDDETIKWLLENTMLCEKDLTKIKSVVQKAKARNEKMDHRQSLQKDPLSC